MSPLSSPAGSRPVRLGQFKFFPAPADASRWWPDVKRLEKCKLILRTEDALRVLSTRVFTAGCLLLPYHRIHHWQVSLTSPPRPKACGSLAVIVPVSPVMN